jgi:DNA-binding XRE family transcriptional regulator
VRKETLHAAEDEVVSQHYSVQTVSCRPIEPLCVRTRSILKSLGEEVRERRKERNLSQEALAHLAGIHTNVVGRLERGTYNPTVLILLAITTKLNTSLVDLFAGAAKRQ